jgi:glycerol-3-phosphate O-acyltransferase
MNIFQYILIAIGIIIGYELIRSFLKKIFLRRQNRSMRKFFEMYNVKLDKYKFMNKVMVKQELMNNHEINQAIMKHAEENDLRISDVKDEVEEYIDEIVPFFNLLSYFKIGYWIANFFLNYIYEVVIDKKSAEKLDRIKKDNVVVFVMNHRSNIDYIIVAYMLARHIALSYAVGEWARVWPLEYIFKSFGAYFVRRKFRKKLYHKVLEKYVQLISLQGVTQGIFPEGGLSRDGLLRDPKLGILDYIIRIKSRKDFKKDIVFVPVGINYDWVLEDKILIREWKEKKEKTGFKDNIASFIRILVKGPLLLFINSGRILTGRVKHHGYASVSFGDPVSVNAFIKNEKHDFLHYDRKRREKYVGKFAAQIMEKIGNIIPVTPVSLTASALLSKKDGTIPMHDLEQKIMEIRKKLKIRKSRIVLGKAFQRTLESQKKLTGEKKDRQKELVDFEEEFLEVSEAKRTLKTGLYILEKRKFIKIQNGKVSIEKDKIPFLQFYANSLNSLI